MIAPGQLGRLLAEILAAGDEAEIVDLLVGEADAIAEMPSRERERVNERIADAIREYRERRELREPSRPLRARRRERRPRAGG